MWMTKETNSVPKGRSDVPGRRNAGLPTEGDLYGNGTTIVVSGREAVTVHTAKGGRWLRCQHR
jgi:hypothetical protein